MHISKTNSHISWFRYVLLLGKIFAQCSYLQRMRVSLLRGIMDGLSHRSCQFIKRQQKAYTKNKDMRATYLVPTNSYSSLQAIKVSRVQGTFLVQ